MALIAWPSHDFASLYMKNSAINTLATTAVLTVSFVVVSRAGVGQAFAKLMPIAFIVPLAGIV
jgi:hypothetical protein